MSNLCDVCRQFGIFQEEQVNSGFSSSAAILKQKHRKHYRYVRELRQSAETGCQFCIYVWTEYRQRSLHNRWWSKSDEELLAELDDLEIGLTAEYQPDMNEIWSLDLKFNTSVVLEGHRRYFFVHADFTSAVLDTEKFAQYKSLVNQKPDSRDKATGKVLPYRGLGKLSRFISSGNGQSTSELEVATKALPYQALEKWPSGSTKDQASFDFARIWLTFCLLNHPECFPKSELQSWHPHRLIYVGTNAEPALQLKTADEIPSDVKYFSLSHCWGDTEMFRLLISNIDELKTSIPHDKLPKTFQEVIHFVRSTEIQYIWIDSLCIIQDSMPDWQTQSSQMSKIYTRAICNIAASASSNGTQGLFRTRSPESIKPLYLAIQSSQPFRHPPNAPTKGLKNIPTGLYQLTSPDTFWLDNTQQTPLADRAWVFQESLLARRTLYFSNTQILFECTATKRSETYPLGLPLRVRAMADYHTQSARMKHPLRSYDYSDRRVSHPFPMAYINWAQIVTAYSSLKLTKPEDKFPAISGVAQEYQKITGGRYVAGLWEAHLLTQLLWKVPRPLVRPDGGWRAPSWSWAAVEGRVEMPFQMEICENVPEWMVKEGYKSEQEVLARVLGFDVSTVEGEGEMGRVKNGKLKIRGRLAPVGMEVMEGYDEGGRILNPYVLAFTMEYPQVSEEFIEGLGYIYVDVFHREVVEEGEYFCVPFSVKGVEQVQGVVLKAPWKSKGQFERCGVFEGGEWTVKYFLDEQRIGVEVKEGLYVERFSDTEFPEYEFVIV